MIFRQGFITSTSSLTEEKMNNFENCSTYFKQRGYTTGYVTEDELDFPVAYSCKWFTLA